MSIHVYEEKFSQFMKDQGGTILFAPEAKHALRDPKLNRDLKSALLEIRDTPGTSRFHRLNGTKAPLFGINVGSQGRAILHMDGKNSFSVVGVWAQHADYDKFIRMNQTTTDFNPRHIFSIASQSKKIEPVTSDLGSANGATGKSAAVAGLCMPGQ